MRNSTREDLSISLPKQTERTTTTPLQTILTSSLAMGASAIPGSLLGCAQLRQIQVYQVKQKEPFLRAVKLLYKEGAFKPNRALALNTLRNLLSSAGGGAGYLLTENIAQQRKMSPLPTALLCVAGGTIAESLACLHTELNELYEQKGKTTRPNYKEYSKMLTNTLKRNIAFWGALSALEFSEENLPSYTRTPFSIVTTSVIVTGLYHLDTNVILEKNPSTYSGTTQLQKAQQQFAKDGIRGLFRGIKPSYYGLMPRIAMMQIYAVWASLAKSYSEERGI